jgi:integrase
MKLFISYSSDDKQYVYELAKALGDEISQHIVWLDRKLFGGQKWWNAILDEIENCECFVAVLTPRSISSIFCSAELEYADKLNKPMLPLVMKPCELPPLLSEIQSTKIEGMAMPDVLRHCEKSLGEIRIGILSQQYSPPSTKPPRPPLPQPVAKSGQRLNANTPHLSVRLDVDTAMIGLSENTKRAYRRWLRRYWTDFVSKQQRIDFRAVDLNLLIPTLNDSDGFRRWLVELQEEGLSWNSASQARAGVVWIAQLLVEQGYIKYPVAAALTYIKTPHVYANLRINPQKEALWLADSEIKKLIRSISQGNGTDAALTARNRVIILFMVTCGLSRDEVVKTTWSDIIQEDRNNLLQVHGRGEKLRKISLPDIALRAIEDWRNFHPFASGNNAMFTRVWKGGAVTRDKISNRTVWLLLQDATKRAGIPPVSPEVLRRSFARAAYAAGVSLEKLSETLGHSDPGITKRYINAEIESSREHMDAWANSLDED